MRAIKVECRINNAHGHAVGQKHREGKHGRPDAGFKPYCEDAHAEQRKEYQHHYRPPDYTKDQSLDRAVAAGNAPVEVGECEAHNDRAIEK